MARSGTDLKMAKLQAESAATSYYTPPEVADGTGVCNPLFLCSVVFQSWRHGVKCIMKRRRTRLDVGRKDDKEEAATKVFDTMIRNTSPKVGEESEGKTHYNVDLLLLRPSMDDDKRLMSRLPILIRVASLMPDIVAEFGPDEETVRL
ncbi:hypothetical protein Tco_1260957 [Tanacetum coccineum]